MAFSALGITKTLVTGAVGIGTGKIVKEIINKNVEVTSLFHKVTVAVATVAISGIVSTHTRKFSDDMIDDIVENVTEVADKVKLITKLNRVNRGKSTLEEEGIDETKVRKNPKTNKWEMADIVEGTAEVHEENGSSTVTVDSAV